MSGNKSDVAVCYESVVNFLNIMITIVQMVGLLKF